MQGDGKWGLQSVYNSLLFLSPHLLCLLQHRVSPMGYGSSLTSPWVFSSRKVPAWVPPWGCSPSGTEFPGASQVLSPFCRLMFLVRTLLQHWLSKGCSVRVVIYFAVDLHGTVFIMGCRGISTLLSGSPPFSSSPWTLVSVDYFSYITLTLPSQLLLHRSLWPYCLNKKHTAFCTTLQYVLFYVFTHPNLSSASTNRLFSFPY